ncbi:MAG: GspE/PulE family protein [Candidatus Sumerlaeota bacterium]|nr:GspE/PulE family protein [Candidatus Sumerlaeota bacterium]
MKITRERLAILLRESGLLTDEQWNRYVHSLRGSRALWEALNQDVSLGAFKDLLFAEIPLPFLGRRQPIHEALSSESVSMRPSELIAILKAFRPGVSHATGPLIQAGIIRQADIDAALKGHDSEQADPYERLVRQNVLTPEALTLFFRQAERRRAWPYRRDLILSILREENLIDEARAQAIRAGEGFGDLIDRILETGPPRAGAIPAELAIPSIDLTQANVDKDLARRFPASLVQGWRFLPLRRDDGTLEVAAADPMNLALGDLLWLLTGLRVRALRTDSSALDMAIRSIFGSPTAAPGAERLSQEAAQRIVHSPSTVQLVSSIIEGAIDLKATDVHLEPYLDARMRVRYRIDGRLRNILMLPADAVQPVISRIKVLANMDVVERRRPQDGHFDFHAETTRYDFRVSTLPCHLGEKIVIRVLDESRVLRGLQQIGLLDEQRRALERLCRQPYGMILVTGPTGSGKSSTLYSCISLINSLETNIVTIEDPVEYQLPGVNQVPVNEDVEMSFAHGLRAILRQDPDVIMVGEIRDFETAAIAIRAALTGRLVFSTLHTNTALGAYTALAHMGVKPYLAAGAILAVVAQRLVRKVCVPCRATAPPNADLALALWPHGGAPAQVARGQGCEACMGTGYQGRTALFEILEATPELRAAVADDPSEISLARHVPREGVISILDAGRRKIEAGETTMEEVCYQVMTMSGT